MSPQETILHCTEGVKLLARLPETPERHKQELALRMTFSPALSAIRGHASAELEQNLQRAYELCQDLNDPEILVPVLTALTRLYMVRADRTKTEAFLEQERQLLSRALTPADALMLHTQMGTANLYRGAHEHSQEHYMHALELYDDSAHRSLLFRFSVDPKSVAMTNYGWSLCLRGWPEQAWNWERRALEYTKELAHPFSW